MRVGRERGVRGRCDRDMIAAGAGAGRNEGRVFFRNYLYFQARQIAESRPDIIIPLLTLT